MQRGDFSEAVAERHVSFKAKFFENFNAGQRGGDYRGLHHPSGNRIRGGGQGSTRIKVAHRIETAPPNSAIKVSRRTLAGKEEADARACLARPQEYAIGKLQAGDRAGLEPGPERCQASSQFRRLCRRTDR